MDAHAFGQMDFQEELANRPARSESQPSYGFFDLSVIEGGVGMIWVDEITWRQKDLNTAIDLVVRDEYVN
jgi:hypothetical protein